MGINSSKVDTSKSKCLDTSITTFRRQACDEIVFGYSKLYGNCLCIPEPNFCELQDIACDIYSFKLPHDVPSSALCLKKDTVLIIRKYHTDSIEVLLELGHGRQLQNPDAQWFQIIKILPSHEKPPKSSVSVDSFLNTQVSSESSNNSFDVPQRNPRGTSPKIFSQGLANQKNNAVYHSSSSNEPSGFSSSSLHDTTFSPKRMDEKDTTGQSNHSPYRKSHNHKDRDESNNDSSFNVSFFSSKSKAISSHSLGKSTPCHFSSLSTQEQPEDKRSQVFVTPLLRRRRTRVSTSLTQTSQSVEEESHHTSGDSVHSLSITLTPPQNSDHCASEPLTDKLKNTNSSLDMIKNEDGVEQSQTFHQPLSCDKHLVTTCRKEQWPLHRRYSLSSESSEQDPDAFTSPTRSAQRSRRSHWDSTHYTRSGRRY